MSTQREFRYPGIRQAVDGNTAVIMCERESTDAAGAYPITPSTQMGEYWAEESAKGHINISGRPLIFIEPEGEHAAAAVTAGLSMTGLRAANFSSGQGIAYMHESLYAAVGKRLTYVLNMGCRAMTKSTRSRSAWTSPGEETKRLRTVSSGMPGPGPGMTKGIRRGLARQVWGMKSTRRHIFT